MHGDAALSEEVRRTALPETDADRRSQPAGAARTSTRANILFNVLKMTGANGITVGPVLLGAQSSAHRA